MSLTPPRRLSMGRPNAQAVPELLEQWRWQALGHDIGNLMTTWDLQNPELAKGDLFSDKMYVKLYVLRPSMVNWILR